MWEWVKQSFYWSKCGLRKAYLSTVFIVVSEICVNAGSSPKAFQVRCRGSCRATFLNFDIPSLWDWHLFPHAGHHHHAHDHHRCCPSSQDCMRVVRGWLRIRSQRCRLHLATEHLIPPTLSSPITCSAKNVQTPLLLIHNMISSTTALHNATAVNYDALVVKSFHVFEVVATGAYYPKLEFENHKNQYFSWLFRSEHVRTNIFGNRMTKLTI